MGSIAEAVEKVQRVRWSDKTIKALRDLEGCGLVPIYNLVEAAPRPCVLSFVRLF